MRTRLPVQLKLAVVTAALTFGILCLFAVVIGAVAEQRIRAGFDDDLRADAADLVRTASSPAPGRARPDRGRPWTAPPRATPRCGSRPHGEVRRPGRASRRWRPWARASPTSRTTAAARELTAARRSEDLRAAAANRWATWSATSSTPSRWRRVDRTVNRVRLFLAFGVLGGTLLAFLGGLYVAQRAMRPIAGLTRAAREVARTRDPDITLPKPHANDEVSDLATRSRTCSASWARRAQETEATLDRQREFVADASHELRTPLTSILANLELLEAELDGEQREMAELGAALVAADAPAGRRPAAAGARRRRPRGPHAPGRPRRRGPRRRRRGGRAVVDHPVSLDLPAR